MRDLTEDELDILDLTRDLVNKFAGLPAAHQADIGDFVTHTHALQNIVLARPATESIAQGDSENEQPVL